MPGLLPIPFLPVKLLTGAIYGAEPCRIPPARLRRLISQTRIPEIPGFGHRGQSVRWQSLVRPPPVDKRRNEKQRISAKE